MEENEILDFDKLYFTALKCSNGVRWKPQVARYVLNVGEETLKLMDELKNGTYKERATKTFKIFEPKEREILSVQFRDRVYQRTLNDFLIYPSMAKSLIPSNCASQKEKGTDYAREMLKRKLRSFYFRNKGNDGTIIHIDIKKYYPSMNHKIAESMFEEKLPKWAMDRVRKILSVYEGDVGYNPGSQLVQILGIAMLDKIDHFIKEKLKVKCYVRYMDDMVLCVSGNESHYISVIGSKLNEIGLSLNDRKTKCYRMRDGCPFLGFKFSVTNTGKVRMCILNSNLKRRKRKIRKEYPHKSIDEADDSMATWYSYTMKSTSKKRVFEVIEYYRKRRELWTTKQG